MAEQNPVDSPPPMVLPKQRARRRKIILMIVGIILIAGYASCRYVIRGYNRLHRWYAYAGYGNAIGVWSPDKRPLPDSIETLEQTYMTSDRAEVQLPPPSPFPRPWYRPPTGLAVGRYLVIIEPSHERTWRGDRWVIYFDVGTCELNFENLEASELVERLLRDDELRAKNREVQPQSVNGVSFPRPTGTSQTASPE